jgi:hypothetical protein
VRKTRESPDECSSICSKKGANCSSSQTTMSYVYSIYGGERDVSYRIPLPSREGFGEGLTVQTITRSFCLVV